MSYDLETLRGDIFGGITAAVVGLPVALAFGVASGLGAIAGMYGAIAVGFFAAVFGGTRSQISGPTGPMAVAMAVIVTSHADQPRGSVHDSHYGGSDTGPPGRDEDRPLRGLHAILGDIRFMSGIGIIIILLQTLPFLGAPGASARLRGWSSLGPMRCATSTSARSPSPPSPLSWAWFGPAGSGSFCLLHWRRWSPGRCWACCG